MHRPSEPSRRAFIRAYSLEGAPAPAAPVAPFRRLKLQLAPTVMPRFRACPFRPVTSRENDPNTSTPSVIE